MIMKCNDLDSNMVIRINKEKRLKALFVLKTKGKNLTTHLREIVYELAEEYDKMQKNSK